MTINDILNVIFLKEIKWHCRNLDSIAVAKFNVGGFGIPFSKPIIEVKEMLVRKMCLVSIKMYKEEWVRVVCLIDSDDPEDKENVLTVRHILEKLKQFDGELELCSARKGYDFNSCERIHAFVNIFDGTDDKCKKYNIESNYKGAITNFIV